MGNSFWIIWSEDMIRVSDAVQSVVILSALVLLIAGCELSKPMIRADYDPNVDFSRYRTFGFYEKLATDQQYQTLTTQYFKAAVIREMTKRGYALVENDPDLMINFNIQLQEKQQIRTSGYPAGYYGYRWGNYGAWGGYNYDSYTYEYTEGTMNIDMVDRVRNQMVWEGVGIGRVTEDERANAEQSIDEAVALIFEKFPFNAGSKPAESNAGSEPAESP
jgi:Domain of unknown function (DUF4136)